MKHINKKYQHINIYIYILPKVKVTLGESFGHEINEPPHKSNLYVSVEDSPVSTFMIPPTIYIELPKIAIPCITDGGAAILFGVIVAIYF